MPDRWHRSLHKHEEIEDGEAQKAKRCNRLIISQWLNRFLSLSISSGIVWREQPLP